MADTDTIAQYNRLSSNEGRAYYARPNPNKEEFDKLNENDKAIIRQFKPDLVPPTESEQPSAPPMGARRSRRGKKSRASKTKKGGRRHKKSKASRRR